MSSSLDEKTRKFIEDAESGEIAASATTATTTLTDDGKITQAAWRMCAHVVATDTENATSCAPAITLLICAAAA
jgi:hypothetical protein